MPFTWIDPEIIILNEASQRKKNSILYHLNGESKKRYRGTYLQNRNRLTDFKNKLMVTNAEVGEVG